MIGQEEGDSRCPDQMRPLGSHFQLCPPAQHVNIVHAGREWLQTQSAAFSPDGVHPLLPAFAVLAQVLVTPQSGIHLDSLVFVRWDLARNQGKGFVP
jgi:hypothetical protein